MHACTTVVERIHTHHYSITHQERGGALLFRSANLCSDAVFLQFCMSGRGLQLVAYVGRYIMRVLFWPGCVRDFFFLRYPAQ